MPSPAQLNPRAPAAQKPATATKPVADTRPSHEAVALAKLRETHRDEYEFYLKRVREDEIADWESLPDHPVKLQMFCLADYIKAALERTVYEPDDEVEVIVASVPGLPSAFTQGETMEEARENLADAIEGNVLMDLQMGWEIPPIPGSDVKIETVELSLVESSKDTTQLWLQA